MKNQYFFLLIFSLYPTMVFTLKQGEAIPHAAEIYEMIDRHIIKNNTEKTVNSLFGNESKTTFTNEDFMLGINVLDFDTLKNITTTALAKNRENGIDIPFPEEHPLFETNGKAPTRKRWFQRQRYYAFADQTYVQGWSLDSSEIQNKRFYNLMRQSIYAMRYRLKNLRNITKILKDDRVYQIAFLYGNLIEVKSKLNSLMGMFNHILFYGLFLYWLIYYQKILQAQIDIDDTVQNLFHIHKYYAKEIFEKGEARGKELAKIRLEGEIEADNVRYTAVTKRRTRQR